MLYPVCLCICLVIMYTGVCVCNRAPFAVSSTAPCWRKRSGCPGKPAADAPRARLPTVDESSDWTTITDNPAEKMIDRQKPQSHPLEHPAGTYCRTWENSVKDSIHICKIVTFSEWTLLHMWTFTTLSWWFLTLNGLRIPWSSINWDRESVMLWEYFLWKFYNTWNFAPMFPARIWKAEPNQRTKDGVSHCGALTGITLCG